MGFSADEQQHLPEFQPLAFGLAESGEAAQESACERYTGDGIFQKTKAAGAGMPVYAEAVNMTGGNI